MASLKTIDISSQESRLREKWEESLQSLSESARYSRISVLILSWEDSESDFGYATEAEELAAIFRDLYNYTVCIRRLGTHRSPRIQLYRYLAEFLDDSDAEDSLLIVYYAGHAVPGEDGKLLLAGYRTMAPNFRSKALILTDGRSSGNTPRDEKELGLGTIVWNQAESLLRDSESDILLIFDCCHAGALYQQHRARFKRPRQFEMLAATTPDGWTHVPGPKSFTSALIWALIRLKEYKDGFSTFRLYQTIKEAPGFPKEQFPMLANRGIPADKHILLSTLPLKDVLSTPPADENTANSNDAMRIQDTPTESLDKWSLGLQFVWQQQPAIGDVTALAKGLRDLIKSNELPLEQVSWRDLSRIGAQSWPPGDLKGRHIADVASFVALKWRNRVLKRRVDELSALLRLPRATSRSESRQSMLESIPRPPESKPAAHRDGMSSASREPHHQYRILRHGGRNSLLACAISFTVAYIALTFHPTLIRGVFNILAVAAFCASVWSHLTKRQHADYSARPIAFLVIAFSIVIAYILWQTSTEHYAIMVFGASLAAWQASL